MTILRNSTNGVGVFRDLGLVLLGLAVGGLLLAGGCASQPTCSVEPGVVDADREILWQICQTQLKKRGFELDLVDYRHGVIETYPHLSRQWFEFWCQDVVTVSDLLESSLHTMRRTVRLEVNPVLAESHRILCEVSVERFSAENLVSTRAVRAREVFRGSGGRMPTLDDAGETPMNEWVLIGEDNALADVILRDIERAVCR